MDIDQKNASFDYGWSSISARANLYEGLRAIKRTDKCKPKYIDVNVNYLSYGLSGNVDFFDSVSSN
jgi:hypothetical protein